MARDEQMNSQQWRTALVSDLISEAKLEINDGYRVTNIELGPVGIPFVRGGDIGDDGSICTEVADHISPEFHDRVQSKLTRPGDVAFISKGTVGRVGFIREGQPAVVLSPQVCFWRAIDGNSIDSRFLFYLLKSDAFQASLDAVKTQGSMAADYVSLSDQRRFRLTLPPIEEQRAIGYLLGGLDDKIDLNRRMNETLEAMARAMFRSWFVDFAPVRAKADGRQPDGLDAATAKLFPDKIEDSALGPMPKGWRVGKFKEIATLSRDGINPGDFPTEVFDHYSIPAFDEGRQAKREIGEAIKSNKFVVRPEAVLLSKLNPRIERVWLPFPDSICRSLCSTEFLVLHPKDPFGREFVAGLVSSTPFQEVFVTLVTGTSGSHQRVQPDSLMGMDCVIPERGVVERFARLIQPIQARIAGNRKESVTLATIRDALLPKLLSGEVRPGSQAI
jgi:type I restriction enzyme S subunit